MTDSKIKLAIHHKTKGSFSERWITFCSLHKIAFKIVDVFSSTFFADLEDCEALLWHFHHNSPRDMMVAKSIIHSVQQSGKKVFPDINTSWHFDDKVAQKYLLKSINAPMVPSYVFLDQKSAFEWINTTQFPKVFKLKGGAGSSNVRLVNNSKEAKKLVRKAFTTGFKHYNAWGSVRERWRQYRLHKTDIKDVIKGAVRIMVPPSYAKMMGREKGYAYFQDFIPHNNFDIRIIVIDKKAFGLKRMVRENDFRASGSGNFVYAREEFDLRCVSIALHVNEQLKAQCLAYDFVFDEKGNPLIVEISYGFSAAGYDDCPGYWDENIQWIEGKFNPQGWMVEALINSVQNN
jgi:glutathione synthase/RimK-type ligase-like ATP-grasp enzyme